MSMVENHERLLEMTTTIVSAAASGNTMHNIGPLIREVYDALASVGAPAASVETKPPRGAPAVSVRKSVAPDHIVCLEDGKKFRSLKRHIRVAFGLTPAAYRERWGLPDDYPMVAPNYAKRRSEIAKTTGLGTKRP